MTTNEVSEYLKLHEITICKYAAAGAIPAIRIGSVWRFDKNVIDDWISFYMANRGQPLVNLFGRHQIAAWMLTCSSLCRDNLLRLSYTYKN